jgi:cobalt-zinc-cadmium efflux system outer membrane protein
MGWFAAKRPLRLDGHSRRPGGEGGILRGMGNRLSKFALLLCLFPVAGYPAAVLTLADVESAVRSHNPEVAAARARAGSARSQAWAQAAWPSPGLGITREDFPRPGFALDDYQRKSVVVSQEVPFPGKTYLAWRAGSAEAEKAEAEARQVLQEQLFQARQAWWDLVVATQSATIYGRAADTLAGLVALSGKRNQFGQSGRMEQLMLPMARMEKADIDIRRLELAQARLEAQAALNELMGEDPGRELAVSPPTDSAVNPGLEDPAWLEGEINSSPAVEVALKDLKALQARRLQARAAWLPDLMLEYGSVEMRDGGKTGMATAKISLPMAWFWRPLAENRAASGGVEASRADADRARLEVRRLALVEISRLALARRQAEISRNTLIPQADQALDLAVSGYQSGSIGPADALTAVRSWLAAHIGDTMLAAQVGRSTAVLSRLRGK